VSAVGRWVLIGALVLIAIDGLLVCAWVIWTDLAGKDEPQPADSGGHVRLIP